MGDNAPARPATAEAQQARALIARLALGQMAPRLTAAQLPDHHDFGGFQHVVDVGGRDGTLLASVLRRFPTLRGTVYDTADGLAQASDKLAELGLTERCDVAVGDFFASVPAGADPYLIKSVIHDWSDERCAGILRRCRDALPDHGRVLVVEPVLPPLVDPRVAGLYLSDLNTLVNVGGRERTREDFAALCASAGLAVISVTALPAPNAFSLIEAAPA
ncbi:methyltransferase [Streptomyces buecherae]|uniref:methyltransferase n=1 Tax=Streptomyces buecherae TaxID=2763006 RepID=UPI0036781151